MATNDCSSETSQTQKTKKPYEKPAFRHEQVFVTTALSCGKIATQISCASAIKAS